MTQFQTIYIHTWETGDGHRPTLAERAAMRKTCGPYQLTPAQPGGSRGFYQSSRGLLMGDAAFSLRLELANDHLTGRLARINGYYCDSDGMGDTLQPIVARLPHGRGFLAGYTMGAGMAGAIDLDVYQDIAEAARGAHHFAETIAEAEAERNREWRDTEQD